MSDVTTSNLINLFDDLPDAPLPIYAKLKQAITMKISSGEWQTNQRVPSEAEVVKALGVSRMTVNRALRELTAEGYLVRHQGLGTFVAEKKAHSALFEVHNIAEEVAAIERGEMDAENNPLKHAPHTVASLVGDWDRPYSREAGCFPAGSFRVDKYWPPVGRVDNVHGDRNLICTCPPMEEYLDAAE